MYLIVKHDFDNMDNHNPDCSTNIGYIKDELDADAWIESQNDRQYRGWNGIMYPFYTKEKLEKLNM